MQTGKKVREERVVNTGKIQDAKMRDPRAQRDEDHNGRRGEGRWRRQATLKKPNALRLIAKWVPTIRQKRRGEAC